MSINNRLLWLELRGVDGACPKLAGGHGYGASQLRCQGSLLSNIEFETKSTIIPLPPPVDTTGLPIVAKFNKVNYNP